MSTFTFLEASLQDAFAILQTIAIPGEVLYGVRKFKSRVVNISYNHLFTLGLEGQL